MLKPVKIKNLTLKSNLFLAPMAQITNYPLRKILLLNGCDLVITEMVSSKSLYYKNKKSLKMIEVRDDKPICIQIFGGDIESMLMSAELIQEKGADMIEINAGCPVKKVVKAGAGIALFNEPHKLAKIVYEISKRITIPISVKMRLGIKKPDECIEVARLLQENGASLIHLHMRTVSQMHSGPVNFEITKKLREILKIPLVANGGIKTPYDAVLTFKQTNADAISIGQGAISNPFIFNDIKKYIKENKYVKRDIKQKIELLIEYLKLYSQTFSEKEAFIGSRKIIGLWLSNFQGAKEIRNLYMKAKSLVEAICILQEASSKL
ncbi:MAG: tRNA-dihydrouridine synthase family protein [Elusimicrobiales bacterium]|nr:tRNA-dihydrouridine synthase family protein [Elusimicrobiales bacterium]